MASVDRRAAWDRARDERVSSGESQIWCTLAPATRGSAGVSPLLSARDARLRFQGLQKLAHQNSKSSYRDFTHGALEPLGGKAVRGSPWIHQVCSSAGRLKSGALRRRAMAVLSARQSGSPLQRGLCSRVAALATREAGDERGRRHGRQNRRCRAHLT